MRYRRPPSEKQRLAVVGRPRAPRQAARLALICAVLGVFGCSAARRAPGPQAPAVLPSATQLEEALEQRREALQGLRALAHMRYRDPQESSSAREAIIVARPDRVRVEVLSLFGSEFVLTANGREIAAYVPRESTVYRGEASAENLWRYTRLWMPVPELVDIVLGSPRVPAQQRGEVRWDDATGSIQLQYGLESGARTVWFSPALVPTAAAQSNADGRVNWRATYGAFEGASAVPVATRIGLELPMWARSVELTLEDVDVNPTLDQALFALQTPPGSKVVQLDQAAD